ncbi:hypothetical protein [Streptomyces sp. NPDC002588]|uniref:hypothetical protein n=1 Tax=Streptomyces sp. NPDC002588 TaxID=3154419 RepID=UPI00332208B8
MVGILVTVLVGRPSPTGEERADGGGGTQPSSGAESTPATTAGESAEAARVRYGPVVFDADMINGGVDVELDSTAPVVAATLVKGSDLFIGATTGSPTFDVPDGDLGLAPLPASGSAPTDRQCAEAVERNGTYNAQAPRGARFCLMTDQGRTAYLRVVSAPPGGDLTKFEVTVWETPDA